MIKATVIIATFNMGNHIKKTIESVLVQTESDFELIVIDDASTDDTLLEIKQIKDKRLKLVKNIYNLGKSLSRNKGITLSKSKYIFFTDADCIVDKNWIKQGLKALSKSNVVGVEGKILYIAKGYVPSYSDRVVQNLQGGEYMTANIVYKREYLKKVGMFNKAFARNQDRDLALRVMKFGKIAFNTSMLVYHSQSIWKAKDYMASAQWVYYRVVLAYKLHGERYQLFYRIYSPEKIAAILFPPLILIKLFTDKHKTKQDYLLFLLVYPRLIYERVLLWKYSFKERVLII